MATLEPDDVTALHQEIMGLWSECGLQTPLDKAGVAALIDALDAEMETFETSFVSGLEAGSAKTWLEATPDVTRWLIERVAAKRRAAL